ncbi:MAG: ATP-binding cassette domain-containing protein [bacterium]|nr:ATP-binding cassette domain-containing protein [bacterium]
MDRAFFAEFFRFGRRRVQCQPKLEKRVCFVIELRSVCKSYPRGETTVAALEDVSLSVRPGEMAALVGPSGCGKSTCLNLIAGADRPESGKIVVFERDLAAMNEHEIVQYRRREVGVVFQAFHLMPHLTVRENVALPQAIAGERDLAWVDSLIESVGLTHRAGHYPSELSGGEQQRTAVARALAMRPRLIVADEPTGNLDSRSGAAVLDLLNDLRREAGATLILATHDPAIAGRADRLIAMKDGRVQDGAHDR